MQVQMYRDNIPLGKFEDLKDAVLHYIANLFDRDVEKLGAGVVLLSNGEHYRIRSQFDGHRKPNCYMVATRFGGVIFDYFKPTPTELKAMKAKADKIRQDVYATLADQFGLKPSEIKDTDTLDTLGGDSLDAVEVIMRLEEDFEVEITDSEADKWQNAGQIVAYFEAEADRARMNELATAKRANQTPNYEVPGMTRTANKVEVAFASASKSMVAAVRADLKALDKAETQAHTKAMVAVDALPEVKRNIIIMPNSWYVTLGQGKKKVIVDGPYKTRTGVSAALRTFVRKNPAVNPLMLFVAMGRILRAHGTPFSPDYVPRRAVIGRVAPQVKTKRIDPERVKAQQELIRKRRLLSRANSSVMRATAPLHGKLYVVDDKTNLMVSGPYSSHAAALKAIPENAKGLILLTGQHCAMTGIEYARQFKAVAPKKMHSHFFAEGQPVLVNGKRAKIVSVDNKAKTATVRSKSSPASDAAFSFQAFTLHYAACLLALNTK